MVLPWLAAAWVLGLAASPLFSFPEWQWATLAIVAGLAAWATRREPRLGWAFLTICCCFLGGLRATVAESQPGDGLHRRVCSDGGGGRSARHCPYRADRLGRQLHFRSAGPGDRHPG